MSFRRPGTLAVQAVNQYRRRDVMAYLALRYYLDNAAARDDQWATSVATRLVMTRTSLPYFHAQHFKEINQQGHVEHREMFIPGANEALAEAALLSECAQHGEVFSNPKCVFSYQLAKHGSRAGYFAHYSHGLRQRNLAIADACELNPDGIVYYTDIKKFYPSISTDIASRAWLSHCSKAQLPAAYRGLGEKLIDDYGNASRHGMRAVLTGPMFSHLLGNLIFREVDEYCSTRLPARYFRYVDDIVLVGSEADVSRSLAVVRDTTNRLGLQLHDDESPKALRVSCRDWLPAQTDFHNNAFGTSWARLISALKRFMLKNPQLKTQVQRAFRDEGMRIPVLDYSNIVLEADYSKWVLRWLPWKWFRRQTRQISVEWLIDQAKLIRDAVQLEFRRLVAAIHTSNGFERKRQVPKLRYAAARLIYLSHDDALAELGTLANEVSELQLHANVMLTVADGNIDRVAAMGTNAAQATAQPLVAAGKAATTSLMHFPVAKEQFLAVLLLNGVNVTHRTGSSFIQSQLLEFATRGPDIAMMRESTSFLGELACLHGVASPRHAQMLSRVFDQDESLTMDAVEQLHQSGSP
jgi:hypothetical protein